MTCAEHTYMYMYIKKKRVTIQMKYGISGTGTNFKYFPYKCKFFSEKQCLLLDIICLKIKLIFIFICFELVLVLAANCSYTVHMCTYNDKIYLQFLVKYNKYKLRPL